FDNCRELWRECQRWLGDIEATRLAHNQAFTEAMLEQYREFFDSVESSPLNASQARAVVDGERSLLVVAGARRLLMDDHPSEAPVGVEKQVAQ
ncbi:hypothetical protein K4G98_24065, partial [Mycobacterium tuberculosis]|nr:hypothetical protein [Mycobacterium tuberculosis]